MAIEMKPVSSSNIAEIGHDGDTLAVRFKSGALYHYPGVTADQFKELAARESIGKAVRAMQLPGKLVK